MTKVEKTAVYISIAIIIALIFLIVFSDQGYFDYKALKTKKNIISEQAFEVQRENRKLENEIQRLKTDAEYIKHLAKHEHDMAEPEELIFKEKTQNKE